MNDDGSPPYEPFLSPKFRRGRQHPHPASESNVNPLISPMNHCSTPFQDLAMHLLRGLRAIGIALLLLSCKGILRVLLPVISKRYTVLVSFIASVPFIWFLIRRTESQDAKNSCVTPSQDEYLPPKVFECQTTHTRLFPKRHSFTYSYLLVGIPIGWRGSMKSILSSDLPQADNYTRRKTWFSVHAEDYLHRGHPLGGLAEKLGSYLKTQNVALDDYSQAYLVTAPRLLGFSFNPVSFWYLYDKNKTLSAMILEVNNTFDERRMYFLPRNSTTQDRSSTSFVQQWTKDFHVSPFNDREGSYSLSSTDPFEGGERDCNLVDSTIVLRTHEGNAKVVARVFSSKPGLDPTKMTSMDMLLFLGRWWWVGFMTNPRILREARVLWAKGLRVFYRPEVFASSIGRSATVEENVIESFFHDLLQQVSNSSNVVIDYIATAGAWRLTPTSLQGCIDVTPQHSKRETIEVKILTPAFYTGVARTPELPLIFDEACFEAPPDQAMVEVSDSERFRRVLESTKTEAALLPAFSFCSCLIRLLRSGSCDLLWAWMTGSSNPKAAVMLTMNLDLDNHVRSKYNSNKIAEYESACLKVLLADKLALGWTSLLWFYGQLLWLGSLISIVLHLDGWLHRSRDLGIWTICRLGIELFVLFTAQWYKSAFERG